MREFDKDNKIVKNVICNQCGKKIVVERGIEKEGVFSVDYLFGYFSEKDGERHSLDLCESCYDNWIRSFKVPVSIKAETELLQG